MQLPDSGAKQRFMEQIQIVEANLKDATVGNRDQALLALVQKRLDSLAEKYQYKEEVGAARYKLYELQAFVHYFTGHDDDALEFIKQAVSMRGQTYPRAEKLMAQLSLGDSYLSKTANPDKMTKEQRRDQKIGLEGWLAFFTVTVAFSTISYLALTFISFNNLSKLPTTADAFAAGLLSPYYNFLAFAGIVMTVVGVWLIVLLAKWKKLARWLGIMFAVSAIIISFVEYTWYEDISNQITGLGPNSASAGTFLAIIWTVYLCVSKRVKRTLIK